VAMSPFRQVAPVLAVIALATVAAIAVIATHTSGTTELMAKPLPFTKNGVNFIPRRMFEARAGQPLPKGAIVVNEKMLKMAAPHHVQHPKKHAVYHNAPGLPLHRAHKTVVGGHKAVFHPKLHHVTKLGGHKPVFHPKFHHVTKLQHVAPHKNGLKVAKAFPLKNHNLQNHGMYGHMTENILTTHSGPVHVAKGSFKSHLRGAAPQVSARAGPHILNKRQMKMHQQARELAEALDDCRDDAQDDCQTELHLHDKHLKAFEQDQDAADKGLFRMFENAQRIPDANGIRFAHGGMLAQMPATPEAVPGQSQGVDGFGIPDGGSLPGDNV